MTHQDNLPESRLLEILLEILCHQLVGVFSSVWGLPMISIVNHVDIGIFTQLSVLHETSEILVGTQQSMQHHKIPFLLIIVSQIIEFHSTKSSYNPLEHIPVINTKIIRNFQQPPQEPSTTPNNIYPQIISLISDHVLMHVDFDILHTFISISSGSIMNMQKALAAVGNSGKFQFYTAVFVCFKWLVCGFLILGPSYLLMTPTFTCGDKTKLSEADACPIISTCTIDYPYTLTAKRGLYCQNKYLRDSILSSQYIGSIVGLVLLSILADKIGRKIIIVLTLFACAIGPIILAFGGHYNIIPLLFAGSITMGFGAYSVSTVSFTYLAQVNSDKLRQILTVLTSSFWAISEIMFYPMIRFFPQWEIFVGALMIAPSIILILMTYLIVETPTFLHSRNNLNYIAKFNGKQRLTIDEIEDYQPEKVEEYQVQDTLLKWKFLLPVIILSIGQICNNGMYYITQFSINYIGDTFEMNMLLIGGLELIAYIITNLFCQKMRRKLWLIVFLGLSGGIGILFQFVFKNETSGWNPERIVETVFIAVSRLCNTFGFALFNLITTESFPNSIKTTGTGIVEAFSNLGNIVSPFIVTISDHLGIQSIFIGGVVCLIGALALLFAKETLVKAPKNELKESLLTEQALREPNRQSTTN